MKAAITALTGVENIHFPIIRDWIRHFLQDESEVITLVSMYKGAGFHVSSYSISLLPTKMTGMEW